MKTCSKCKEEKPLSEFTKNKTKKGGYNYTCRVCTRKYIKEHYESNKQYYRDKADRYRNELIEWWHEYKSNLSCTKCGLSHPAALDFHHVNGAEKEGLVSTMARHSKKKTLAEVAKCTVLCASCHRIHHYDERIRTKSKTH